MKTIPTAHDINPHDDLDGRRAVDHFLGRSEVEAEELFRENSLLYQEDLMWMGATAFQYYFPAAVAYVRSEAAEADEDMVRCLASIIEFRLAGDQGTVDAVSEEIVALSETILANPDKFRDTAPVSEEMLSKYRGFRDRYR